MSKALKLFLSLAGYLVVISTLLYFSIDHFAANWLPDMFVLLPVFFLTVSALLAGFVHLSEKKKNFNSLPGLLGFRMLVVFIGLLFLIIGMFFDRTHILSFSLFFAGYYIAFSVVETRILVRLNKK